MKKLSFMLVLGIFMISSLGLVSASCVPVVNLLNQDPYPAIPGDYVKLVFQVTGVDTADCTNFNFTLVPNYPISLDPGVNSSVNLRSGSYLVDYGTFFLIPYKVRIDPSAIDDNYTLKVNYASNSGTQSVYQTRDFGLEVKDVSTQFDVFIDSYSPSTHTLTLNVVNIGKNDANALTVKIPSQKGLAVTAGTDKIIGKLSSTDDTTVSYIATPSGIDSINVTLLYTDSVGTRREVNKIVPFSSSSYVNTASSSSNRGIYFYLFILTIVAIIVYSVIRYRIRRKKRSSVISR